MEEKKSKKKVKREPAKVNKAPDGIIFPRLCYDSEGRSKVMSKEEFEKSNYKIFNK